MDKLILQIQELKNLEEDGVFYLTGYANTKGQEDSHGDIPTSFNGAKIYELDRMKLNPVCFVDHYNSASNIAGNFVHLTEDEKGLDFKLRFRPLDQIYNPMVKDAVSSYQNGYGRAISMGGKWLHEDLKNPQHLTKAVVGEISLVGVGSDGSALSTMPYLKAFDKFSVVDLSKMTERDLEGLLTSGIKVSVKDAKTIVSLIKPMLHRDDGKQGQWDAGEWGKIYNKINNITGDN